MGDIKLFSIGTKKIRELQGAAVAVEKSLQSLVDSELETFLAVRFLATEYSTGKVHGGRIDTLGIDENGCPVIIEYKRASNENVINQGLFYLDWLMDHKAEFKLLVLERLEKEIADAIEWSSPRLICIAGDYTKYDLHAVSQINRNIDLMRYRKYDSELLLLELVNAVTAEAIPASKDVGKKKKEAPKYKSFVEFLEEADESLADLYTQFRNMLEALGDDVQIKQLKHYQAFKRIKNFACVELRTGKHRLLVYAKVNPNTVKLEKGFSRDVRNVGHYGTGDLEILISSAGDIERAKPLLERAYSDG
jgi:predicted transport protein